MNSRPMLRIPIIVTLSYLLLACTSQAQITQPATSTAGQSSQKTLPWKPIASPQGILSMSDYAANIRAFGNEDKFNASQKTIEAILDKTIRSGLIPRAVLGRKDLCVAIHVIDYADAAGSLKSNVWYVYHSGISFQEFIGQRIYGSRNIAVLFLHLNTKGLESVTAEQQTKLAADKLADKDTKLKLRSLASGAVDATFLDVHYEAAVVKKTPANVQNLLSILKILNLAQGKEEDVLEVTTNSVIVWGAGVLQNVSVPSDVRVAGYNLPTDDPGMSTARDSHQLGSDVMIDNEGKYWWDASIGIPVNKIKDLQYSSSDNTVQAAQISKQSAYAMFNLILRPVDLQSAKANLMPRILLGFPLASDPWDKLFLGGGMGLPKIMLGTQFFGGVVFNRVSTPSTLTAGSSATQAQLQTDSRLKIQYKLMIGLNVPVKSVIDKLK
ncbi:MAG: hypothetical protein LAO23_05345 [Acidobacteriia bacterium]|nr:hypothetical protein [Terriglobia bacterium]